MCRRIREYDWQSTSLGPLEGWSPSMKAVVDLMLASGHAMQLAWGPERVVLYNDAYAPMLGARHPGALGMPFREAWPDIWDEIEPYVEQVFAGETVRFEEMPLVMTRRGYPEETWWNFSYSPVWEELGVVAGLLNVTVDATPKHRAEQAERELDAATARLEKNEARFRALVTAGGNSIYQMSPDWRQMYQLDSQTLANTAAPIDDWVPKYIPDMDLPEVRLAIEKAIGTKSLFELEHRVRLANGDMGWVHSRAVPLLGQDGRITEWFGAGSDVTARRTAEERLRTNGERQAFPLSLNDAFRATDSAEAIGTTCVQMLAAHMGLARAYVAQISEEQGTATIGPEYHDQDLPPVTGTYYAADYPELWDKMKAGWLVIPDIDWAEELTEQAKASIRGAGLSALISVHLYGSGHGAIWSMFVGARTPQAWGEEELHFVQDVAERTWAALERARAEAALHEADRHKDQFLAVLAHELRNGLAPLVYNVQIANRRSDDAALTKALFARSGRQLQHLVHLVDDLLDIARINTGKIELNLESVRLRDVVNLALDACRPDADRKQHRLTVIDEAAFGLTVSGDTVRLTQVVSNLLSNAIKYMDDGGSITVRTARDGGQALIEVSDTGIGIPSAAMPHVFELFTQVRDQQAYSAGGLGIGLALVRQLVEMHRGTVSAASEGKGQGSTFAVRLPLAAAGAVTGSEAAALAAAALPGRLIRVLVVDDKREIADALVELVLLMGHDAEAAYGGPHALECANRRRPDVVFLDLGMPGMDGFEVARQLRANFPAEPPMRIMALTGRGREIDRQQTKAASFDGHLDKPVGAADLQAVLAGTR